MQNLDDQLIGLELTQVPHLPIAPAAPPDEATNNWLQPINENVDIAAGPVS
ncbi:hypothetical protein M0765_014010 [Variovorax sp. S2]|uniref:hypothetical protein n=1 Tax=Variovorax sp. S12S4 TaxID=3029170 RepID=UPI00215D47A4|nr:hypothetical protein [Variovorax sp. S12S4]MCR8958802.1 hypothetical protein [Variovorax sp. S12S4]